MTNLHVTWHDNDNIRDNSILKWLNSHRWAFLQQAWWTFIHTTNPFFDQPFLSRLNCWGCFLLVRLKIVMARSHMNLDKNALMAQWSNRYYESHKIPSSLFIQFLLCASFTLDLNKMKCSQSIMNWWGCISSSFRVKSAYSAILLRNP